MNYRTRLALVLALTGLAVTQAASAQVAAATPAGYATDSDQPLTGDAYAQATAAALKFTGQGTVTDTEAEGPRGSEVEVRLATAARLRYSSTRTSPSSAPKPMTTVPTTGREVGTTTDHRRSAAVPPAKLNQKASLKWVAFSFFSGYTRTQLQAT